MTPIAGSNPNATVGCRNVLDSNILSILGENSIENISYSIAKRNTPNGVQQKSEKSEAMLRLEERATGGQVRQVSQQGEDMRGFYRAKACVRV